MPYFEPHYVLVTIMGNLHKLLHLIIMITSKVPLFYYYISHIIDEKINVGRKKNLHETLIILWASSLFQHHIVSN